MIITGFKKFSSMFIEISDWKRILSALGWDLGGASKAKVVSGISWGIVLEF